MTNNYVFYFKIFREKLYRLNTNFYKDCQKSRLFDIVSRKWLKQETGLSNHVIDNLVKSEQLKLLWKGSYTRGIKPPTTYARTISST